jgi:hypothetical protein
MKALIYSTLCVFLSLSICQVGLTAGGKGNVKQLGEKIYVWHFDEGKGKQAKDETAGLVGEFDGDVKWAEGISGNAVQMAGEAGKADFIDVAHSDELDIDEAITMMAWVYPDELPAGGQENKFTIFYKNTYYLQIEPGAGQLAYYFYDTNNPGYHISDGKIKAKEWSHVALVWDGSEARFYINGESDGTAIGQKGPGLSRADKGLRFGGENNGCCPRFFQGRIDELMLANYALSEADIQKIINDTLDVSARGKLTMVWGKLKR